MISIAVVSAVVRTRSPGAAVSLPAEPGLAARLQLDWTSGTDRSVLVHASTVMVRTTPGQVPSALAMKKTGLPAVDGWQVQIFLGQVPSS